MTGGRVGGHDRPSSSYRRLLAGVGLVAGGPHAYVREDVAGSLTAMERAGD